MRVLRRKLHFLVAALLLVTLATPCAAVTAPSVTPVASWEEFLARYHSENSVEVPRVYVSEKPLICTASAVLGGTLGQIELAATQGLRVAPGGVLTLDNPNLLLMGPPPCMTVERGGTLRILRWHPMMTDGVMPTAGMIRVEVGGMLQVAEGLKLPEGMVSVEEELPPNNALPPIEPEPEPGPKPELIPVEGLYDPIQYLSCGTGLCNVKNALSAAVEAYLAGGLMREFEVCWDFSELPCDAPGTYLIYGDFTTESLAEQGASNPKGLRPAVSLTLLTSSPIGDLSWRALSTSGGNSPTLRLSFSALPADTAHLYLAQSTDGVHWKQCVRYDTSGHPAGTDFLSAVQTSKGTGFLLYQMPKDFDTLYLRLEVDGSVCAGSSNPIRIQSSDFGELLGSGGPNSDAEDDSSGGNRGGGQGTFDREGQQKIEATPAVPEVVKEPALPQEAPPQQLETNPEPEAVPLQQENSFSGSAGEWSGYDGALSEEPDQPVTQPLVRHGSSSVREAVPEVPNKSADIAATPEEPEVPQPTLDGAVSVAQAQPLAAEIQQTETKGDGDTSGMVAVATLAVCLCSGVGLYFLHKRSLKRKS